MLPKPDLCKTCPFAGDMMGYVPDEVRPIATVAYLAHHPGADEERVAVITGYHGHRNPLYQIESPRPLLGAEGYKVVNTYFPLAGLSREDVSLHHLIKCRYKHSNVLPRGAEYEDALQHCITHHLEIPPHVQVIIAPGAHAKEREYATKVHQLAQGTWEYTQGKGYPITDWRGFIGPTKFQGRHVYAVQHPYDYLRDALARFVGRLDWKRLGRLLSGGWPHPVPDRVVACPERRGDFTRVLQAALEQPEIMVDTEYIVENKLLTHVGAAWKSGDTVEGFQLEWIRGQATSVERAIFMRYWPQLCEKTCMGFWNAKADLPILQHNLHHTPRRFEDPMQAHAVLWPDMEHTYEFAASIYGRYNKLKHLAKTDMLLYHWGDMIDLVWIWEALKDEFKHDPQAEQKYRQQNLKLIPILLATESHGIRVNQRRITEALPTYRHLVEESEGLAGAYCGYPINVGSSPQVQVHLATEGITLKTIDKDVIAVQRSKYLPFEADYEEEHGFSSSYIMERVEHGAHPLLETRVMYATNAKIISNYLTPFGSCDRFYVEINIHTQAGGRHSVSRLGTIPPDLLDIVMPDEGEVFISFDWDAQEPRIQAAESGSRVLNAAFTQGEDIHTTFVCQLYGWSLPTDRRNPHTSAVDAEWRAAHAWGGKDDPRRVFAKTTRYEINYGGDGSKAAQKAIRMGVQPAIAKRAAQVLLESDPELVAWFRKIEREVERTHMIHSWDGGRRVWFWVDNADLAKKMKREARNFPPQGGGAGLHNLTIIEINEKVPEAKYVYGRHDSQTWRCQVGIWPRIYRQIKAIATQPRLINGVYIPFPATFKVMFDDGRVEKIREE